MIMDQIQLATTKNLGTSNFEIYSRFLSLKKGAKKATINIQSLPFLYIRHRVKGIKFVLLSRKAW